MTSTTLPRSRFAPAALLGLATLLPGGIATAQPHPAANLPNLKMFQPLKAAPAAPAAPQAGVVSYAAPPSATAAPPVQVTLTFPDVPDTAFAAIRGPGGEVRYFPIEGGRKELATRVIVVRPGERVHIQLPPPKPR
jgi:hypothetical protein